MTLVKTSALLIAALAYAAPSSAAIVFDFVDDGGSDPTEALDGGGIGATVSATDGSDTVALTTVDILAPEYSSTSVATGNTLYAGSGDGVTTNIPGNADALGVNNPSIGNNDWDTIGGGSESGDFNPGESWVFEFDTAVTIDSIEFESMSTDNVLTVLVDNVAIATYDNVDGDVSDPTLAALIIAAGSDVTFAASGPVATTDFRIESLTVSVVPEPGSLALLGLGGLLIARRRRA